MQPFSYPIICFGTTALLIKLSTLQKHIVYYSLPLFFPLPLHLIHTAYKQLLINENLAMTKKNAEKLKTRSRIKYRIKIILKYVFTDTPLVYSPLVSIKHIIVTIIVIYVPFTF